LRHRSTCQFRLQTQPPALADGCIARPSLPINLRLSSPANLKALPSNPSSDLRRWLHFPARLSGQPSTFVADFPSARRSNPTSDFHPGRIFRLNPSSRPSACAADQLSGPAFGTHFRLSPAVAFLGSTVPINLRLAPSINLSSFSWKPNLQISPDALSLGSAFGSARDFRLEPIFRPCLGTRPPTFIGRGSLPAPLCA